jgi:hypothetical protein
MKIRRATASPTIIVVGDRFFCISPPSLRMMGMIFGYLAGSPLGLEMGTVGPAGPAERIDTDVLATQGGVDGLPSSPNGEADFESTPELGSPESLAKLTTAEGMVILFFAVLSRDNPEIPIGDVPAILADTDEATRRIILRVALERAPVTAKGIDLSHWKGSWKNGKRDGIALNAMNLGRMFERADFKDFSPAEIADWTIDQFENKVIGGSEDAEKGIEMTPEETQNWFFRMQDPRYRAEVARARAEEERRSAAGQGVGQGTGRRPAADEN